MNCLPIKSCFVSCTAMPVPTGVRSALSVLRDYYVARCAAGGGSKAIVGSNISGNFHESYGQPFLKT